MDQLRDSKGIVPVPTKRGVEHEEWFEEEMLDGIRSLSLQAVYLRPATPDEGAAVALEWSADLWAGRTWKEDRDRNRIRAAFGALWDGHRMRGVNDVSKFPVAADFLDALPRQEQAEDEQAPLTEEQKARAEEARLRLHSLWSSAEKMASASRLEQIRAVNIALRNGMAPEFKSEGEVRRHQHRQEVAGELIAQIKLR